MLFALFFEFVFFESAMFYEGTNFFVADLVRHHDITSSKVV